MYGGFKTFAVFRMQSQKNTDCIFNVYIKIIFLCSDINIAFLISYNRVN